MNWKRIGQALLYPHLAVIILFLPLSVSMLVFSLIYLDTTSILSIICYLFAFYMLVVIYFRIPRIITFFKKFKNENKLLQRLSTDVHLRMNISLYGSLIWNGAFAMLAIMRFFLVKHTQNYKVNEEEVLETKKYILCGWLLLVMNLALSVIVFFIVYWNRTFVHHEITTIMLAAFTFLSFTFAIIGNVKYRKYNSPVYSAAKIISLISATVSILTLETKMLTAFGGDNSDVFKQVMLACTGVAVSIFTITMAMIILVKGYKRLKSYK